MQIEFFAFEFESFVPYQMKMKWVNGNGRLHFDNTKALLGLLFFYLSKMMDLNQAQVGYICLHLYKSVGIKIQQLLDLE